METTCTKKFVSASSIAAFLACPTRYRLHYVEGLSKAVDDAAPRMGTAWHTGLEVLEAPPASPEEEDTRLERAVEAATAIYTTIPDYADPTDWAVEREIIANSLAAYHWLHPAGSSEYETVATEMEFELPLVNPETGHKTPTFVRIGKIDRLMRHKASGRLFIGEHKSSSKSIDSGSSYWDRLRKDVQSKYYILAMRDLQEAGTCPAVATPGASGQGAPLVSGLLHDVWHKPTIKPSKLTMAESAEFVRTGDYCGQKFKIEQLVATTVSMGSNGVPGYGPCEIAVDGFNVKFEFGAVPKPRKDGSSGPVPYSIRETPGMFGARLLQDMTTRPEFYFAVREVSFTDAELKNFEYQIWALQKMMAEMERTGFWYENGNQCEATFKCSYCPICYNNVACCDGVTVPPGYKRLNATVVLTQPETTEE
jgi:hypothetical protein